MNAISVFEQKAPVLMDRLMGDFEDLEPIHAAAIVGNLGHECRGFTELHEAGQPEGKGGYGWAQWTGPRRRSFFAWCEKSDLDWRSDDANYGYLLFELEREYASTISAISKTRTLEAAVASFERTFERAGVVNMGSRVRWGQRAFRAWQDYKRHNPAMIAKG